MLSLVFLLIHLTFALFVFFLTIAFVTGAPFVPSVNATARIMIDLARIKKGMNIYDLGSGDGRLLLLAAQKGATSVGLEINPFLVLFSKLRTIFFPYRNQITTRWQNFWNADLSDADIVFVYLLPWRMERLAEKLKKELKPGSIIVSNSFIFPNWKILRQDESRHIYVFKR
ncbi:hypothetical protein HY948_05410 [Candidatus Gottesmanbacteria bacterium]|nr:hypothetical protein [Candidatus Gottesmanbacteria bacterium]